MLEQREKSTCPMTSSSNAGRIGKSLALFSPTDGVHIQRWEIRGLCVCERGGGYAVDLFLQ